jgi:PAS domain S-box-containing protein
MTTVPPSDFELQSTEHADLPDFLFHSALEHASDPIVITTGTLDTSTLVFVNKAFTRVTGFAADEVIGQPTTILYGPRSNRAAITALTADLDAGRAVNLEIVHYRKDGTPFDTKWHVAPVVGPPPHRATYRISIAVDISEHSTALAGIARAHQEWRDTVDAVDDCIVLCEADARIRRCNRAFADAMRESFTGLIGRPISDVWFGPDGRPTTAPDPFAAGIAETHRPGSAGAFEVRSYPTAGLDAHPTGWVHVIRDLSEQRRMEAVADAVNMMEGVGFVFSGIRHELGNPINSAKVALSVLRTHLRDYPMETIARYIDRALTEIARVEYLLKTLKSFSAHERPQIEAVPLGPFLDTFCSLIAADFHERGIVVDHIPGAATAVVLADPRALHQVLLNLVSNAADALVDRPDPRVRIRVVPATRSPGPAYVDVLVADSGCGMTPAQTRDLFKPFITSKLNGTGLGLVISKKLLLSMNGMIDISSTHGVGTTARVTLEAAHAN